MPFAWMNIEHGQPPGSRLVDGPEDLGPGEIFSEKEPEPGTVWDGATGGLRLLGRMEKLVELRERRKTEVAVEGRANVDALLTDGFERDKLLMKLCASFVQLARETGNPKALDPCILEVARYGKAVQDAHERLDALDLEAEPDPERKIREEGLR